MKIKNIFLGWFKKWELLKMCEAEKKLSALRLKICDRCDRSKDNKILELINESAITVHRKYCTVCKCPCLQKSVVVDEKCPLDKW